MTAALIFLAGFFAVIITPGLIAQRIEAKRVKADDRLKGA